MGLMKILPDTNVFIYALAGRDPFYTVIKEKTAQNELLLSVIVIAEYLVKANSENIKMFDTLINNVRVIPIDTEVARLAAQMRKTSLSGKNKLHLADCFIAAQCQLNHATLATNNPRDYPKNLPKVDF